MSIRNLQCIEILYSTGFNFPRKPSSGTDISPLTVLLRRISLQEYGFLGKLKQLEYIFAIRCVFATKWILINLTQRPYLSKSYVGVLITKYLKHVYTG